MKNSQQCLFTAFKLCSSLVKIRKIKGTTVKPNDCCGLYAPSKSKVAATKEPRGLAPQDLPELESCCFSRVRLFFFP